MSLNWIHFLRSYVHLLKYTKKKNMKEENFISVCIFETE